MQTVDQEIYTIYNRLKYHKFDSFLHLEHWSEDWKYMGICLKSRKFSMYCDWSERTWFASHNSVRELSFFQSVLSDCHAMPWIQYVPVVLSAGHYPTEVDVNGTSPSSASQRMLGVIPVLRSIQPLCLFYRSAETILPSSGCNSVKSSVSSDRD